MSGLGTIHSCPGCGAAWPRSFSGRRLTARLHLDSVSFNAGALTADAVSIQCSALVTWLVSIRSGAAHLAAAGVFEAESNYFPFVEFSQPDLPWRYTPAAANAAATA